MSQRIPSRPLPKCGKDAVKGYLEEKLIQQTGIRTPPPSNPCEFMGTMTANKEKEIRDLYQSWRGHRENLDRTRGFDGTGGSNDQTRLHSHNDDAVKQAFEKPLDKVQEYLEKYS